MQGWRILMEDSHSTVLEMDEGADESVAFFGVYDGHGGEKVALFTGEHLHRIVHDTASYQAGDLGQSLRDGFLAMDKAILEDDVMKHDDSGCAATLILITKTRLVCGNAGDLRTIMLIDGQAKALLYDHKPTNQGERARISAAGGYVDVGRVNGNLALSRAIGDFEFKKLRDLPPEEQVVTAFPDIIEHPYDAQHDEFVVLACDGIWDCLSLQQVVEAVRRGVYEKMPLTDICEHIMDVCCAPSSGGTGIGCDNMSICIVALLNGKTEDEWYAEIAAKIDRGVGLTGEPYLVLAKDLYGQDHEYGTSGRSDGEVAEAEPAGGPAFSLQQLLLLNALRQENGVVYLDLANAASILASFGAGGVFQQGEEEDEGEETETGEGPKIEEA